MNKIAQKIVDILLERKFLNKKRKEEYVYVVEILLEKSNSLAILLVLLIIPYDSYHESQITIPTIRGNRTSNTLFSSTCKVADAQ